MLIVRKLYLGALGAAIVVLTPIAADAEENQPTPAPTPKELAPVDGDKPVAEPYPLQGPIVQLRSGVGVVSGGTLPLPMQRLDRVIRAELVPIRIDLGYRIPHFYIGGYAQKSHEKTASTQLVNPDRPASPCTANDFELGATIEYHPLPTALAQPWIGIYGARRSMWITSDDGQGMRMKGPEAGITGGVDVRLGRRFGLGAFVTAGMSILAVSFDDDTSPLTTHANVGWFGAGIRVWTML